MYTQERTAEAGLLAPLIAAFVPELVNRGISAVANWIEARRQARAESFEASFTARGAGELYTESGGRRIDCVMIYRGTRGDATEATEDWPLEDLGALGLRQPPDFFLELSVDYDSKRTAFRLSPQRLEYRRTAARRSRGSKDLLVVGLIEGAFGQASGAAAAGLGTFEVSLPALAEGTVWDRKVMEGLTSQWIPLPPAPRDEEGAITSTLPVSVLATVEEAEEGSDLLLGVLEALSAAAASSKDTISEQLSADILERLGLDPQQGEGEGEGEGGD